MTTIHHRGAPVKTQMPSSIAALTDRLRAGASERCAHCLTWADRRHAGAVALYVSKDGRPPIAYMICQSCTRLLNGSPDQQQAFTQRVEQYLLGGVE